MPDRYSEGEVYDTPAGPKRELSRYIHCRWCHGAGCSQCDAEADAAYKRAFPNGPQPIATFKVPEEMDAAREAIGGMALDKAFGEGGGGVQEIIENCLRHEEAKKKA